MRCKKCGSMNPEGLKYCGDCGAELGGDRVSKIKREVHGIWQLFLKELLSANEAVSDYMSAPQSAKNAPDQVLKRRISFYRVVTGLAVVIFLISLAASPGPRRQASETAAATDGGSVGATQSSADDSLQADSGADTQGSKYALSDDELAQIAALDAQIDANEVNTEGNSYANIENGGLVARQGDWIYYVNFSDIPDVQLYGGDTSKFSGGYYLYKSRPDGSDRTRLCDCPMDDVQAYINVVGDWVYFTRLKTENNEVVSDFGEGNVYELCKVRTDGTGLTVLSDTIDVGFDYGYLKNVMVIGDKIYGYTRYVDMGWLHRFVSVNTDGTGCAAFTGDYGSLPTGLIGYDIPRNGYALPEECLPVSGFGIVYQDNQIFLQLFSTDSYYDIFSVNQDGSSFTKVKAFHTDDDRYFADQLFISGDWMYLNNNYHNLTRYSLTGDEQQELIGNYEQGCYVNIYKDEIYYISNDGSKICKMSADGSNRQTLLSDAILENCSVHSLNIFDDWIYFYAFNIEDSEYPTCLWRIRTDGTLLQLLEPVS